ncbi:hypothetical protein MKX01_008629, partial [Papaver californicum]
MTLGMFYSAVARTVFKGESQHSLHHFCETKNGAEMQRQEDFPEVKTEFQETFLKHTSSISKCRFSSTLLWPYGTHVSDMLNVAAIGCTELCSDNNNKLLKLNLL